MRTERRASGNVTGVLLAGMLMLAAIARATPEAATWRRQTLIGENAQYFFRYAAISDHPGSNYKYSRTLRLEKVRKSDLRVVESILLRSVTCSQDPNTERWSEAADSVASFDLPGFMRANHVALAFANDLIHFRTFAIDSAGVWEVFEDGRTKLATRKELKRQIPMLGEDPRVVGIEETSPINSEDFYLRIESGSAAFDADWSEDLLLVRGTELH
jgi:hypothetical protein